jgi:hypothetical protein
MSKVKARRERLKHRGPMPSTLFAEIWEQNIETWREVNNSSTPMNRAPV